MNNVNNVGKVRKEDRIIIQYFIGVIASSILLICLPGKCSYAPEPVVFR